MFQGTNRTIDVYEKDPDHTEWREPHYSVCAPRSIKAIQIALCALCNVYGPMSVLRCGK